MCVCLPPIKFFPRHRRSCQPLSRQYQREEQPNLKGLRTRCRNVFRKKKTGHQMQSTTFSDLPNWNGQSELQTSIAKTHSHVHSNTSGSTKGQHWVDTSVFASWETFCSFLSLKLNVSSFVLLVCSKNLPNISAPSKFENKEDCLGVMRRRS